MNAIITIGDFLALAGFLVTVVIAVWKVNTAVSAKVASVYKRCDEISKELNDYKLRAAKEFASVEHLTAVETRLATAIEKLTDRIDRTLTRLDRDAAD